MLEISETTLRHLMTQVVTVTRECRDPQTKKPLVETIEPKALRMAALIALQITTGDVVFPV